MVAAVQAADMDMLLLLPGGCITYGTHLLLLSVVSTEDEALSAAVPVLQPSQQVPLYDDWTAAAVWNPPVRADQMTAGAIGS